MRFHATTIFTVLAGLCLGPAAHAQHYPDRPIRLIVPSAPGSSADVLGRLVATGLSERLGQQVVAEDRPGAAGIVGTAALAGAAPDGYTLVIVAGTHAINASLYAKLPYDFVADFAPVSQVGQAPLMMVANPSLPANTIGELIALAKSEPGKLNFASGGNGTPSHLSMELFKSMAGINIVHVPYTGGNPVMTAVTGGEVPIMADGLLATLPQVRSGRLKALGVTGAKRSAVAPDIPAIAETLPGYEVEGWWGILAPAKTPRPIVEKLSGEIAALLKGDQVRAQLAKAGIEPVGSTPDAFAARIRKEIAQWAKVISDAHIAKVNQ